MPKHRCIRWLSEDPTPWHPCKSEHLWRSSEERVKHRLNRRGQVKHRCIQRTMFQRRCQACSSQAFSTGRSDGYRSNASVQWRQQGVTAIWRTSVTGSSDALASVHPMVPEVAAACQRGQRLLQSAEWPEEPMLYAPGVPMPTQKTGQLLVTALLTWWPIYMCSPSHLMLAGVPRHHTHTQEYLQAIQEHRVQILIP